MGTLKKLLNLSLPDALLLLRVTISLILMDLSLRLLPLHAIQSFLAQKRPSWRTTPAFDERSLERMLWAAEVAGAYVGGTCLTKALAMQWFLFRRGLFTRLWLGVQRGGKTIQAHAWLEYRGRVIVGGPPVERYIPLCCLESSRRRKL